MTHSLFLLILIIFNYSNCENIKINTIKEDCISINNSLITIYVNTTDKPYYMSYELFNSKGKLIDSKSGSKWSVYSEYYYNICVEKDTYSFSVSCPSKESWQYAYMIVSVNDIHVAQLTMKSKDVEKTVKFKGDSDNDYSTEWLYSYKYEDGWNSNPDENNWKKANITSIPKASSTTTYLKLVRDYNNLMLYTSYALSISYVSGIVIYLNGDEIYRNNLPDGEIKEDTIATNSFKNISNFNYMLPMSSLRQSKTIFGIELHRSVDDINFPEIRIITLPIIGLNDDECTVMNMFHTKITEYSKEYQESDKWIVDYGFDRVFDNEWDQSFKRADGIWAKLDFGNTYISTNVIGVYPMVSCSPSPKTIVIQAQRDGKDIGVGEATGFIYTKDVIDYRTLTPNITLASSVFVNITAIGWGEDMYVYDIGFHLCNTYYCSAFSNLPVTQSGVTLDAKCLEGSGNRKFYCTFGKDPKWKQLENPCTDIPELYSNENEIVFTQGESYYNTPFVVFGKDLVYLWNCGIIYIYIYRY